MTRLLDHFTSSGDRFFRWRSSLPLLLLPLLLLTFAGATDVFGSRAGHRLWEVACFAVALVGLALRIGAIGTAPEGTSERSTSNPRASMLRDTGVYSVVRHPLYIGNTLIAIGLAAAPGRWFLPVIVLLASILYYERIAAREEQFLEGRFGESFRSWADRVPALIPDFRHYARSSLPFCWRNVLRREFHATFVIGAGFFLIDLAHTFVVTGHPWPDPLWATVCALSGGSFVVLAGLKRWTSVLDEPASARV